MTNPRRQPANAHDAIAAAVLDVLRVSTDPKLTELWILSLSRTGWQPGALASAELRDSAARPRDRGGLGMARATFYDLRRRLVALGAWLIAPSADGDLVHVELPRVRETGLDPADAVRRAGLHPPSDSGRQEILHSSEPSPTSSLAEDFRAAVGSRENEPARGLLSMDYGSMGNGVRDLTFNGSMESGAPDAVRVGDALGAAIRSLTQEMSPESRLARRNGIRDRILQEVRQMGGPGRFHEAIAGRVADAVMAGGSEEMQALNECLETARRNVGAGKVPNPGAYLRGLFINRNLYRPRAPPRGRSSS